jgi:hypothetical protein
MHTNWERQKANDSDDDGGNCGNVEIHCRV